MKESLGFSSLNGVGENKKRSELRVPTVGWLPSWATLIRTYSQRRMWLSSHFSLSHSHTPLSLHACVGTLIYFPLVLFHLLPFAFPFNFELPLSTDPAKHTATNLCIHKTVKELRRCDHFH